MACQYIYKGKVFNSELELDDYLLLIDDLVYKFGDAVFSVTNPNNTSKKNLTESILSKEVIESEKKRKQYKEWKRATKDYTDEGEPLIEKPPYIGVNKFLNGLKINGKLLFPEFREENYWSERFKKWKNGDFTNNNGDLDLNEILEFGLDPDNLPNSIDSSSFDSMRNSMKRRWRQQAHAGDAIHNVLLLFFTKVDDHYLFEKTDEELESYLYDNLDSDNKPYILPSVVKEVIKYARQLHKDLIAEFGDNLSFYPEFTITLDTTSSDKTTLLGMIDLLIIDSNGKAHILDYKTSTHDYLHFGEAKQSMYNYLLSVYQRILEAKGIDVTEGKLLISPIQLINFRHEGDTYLYDNIEYINTFEKIGENIDSLKIGKNIDTFLSVPIQLHTTLSLALSTISDVMGHWYPAFETNRTYTKEYVIDFLKRRDLLTPDKNNNYVFSRGKNEDPIISTDKIEFIDKVLNYLLNLEPTRKRLTGKVKSLLRLAMKTGIKSVDFILPFLRNKGESVNWLSETISPYCNGNWKIVDNPLAEEYGLIMLQTIDGFEPRQVDFIRISSNDLYEHYYNATNKDQRLKYGRGLTGLFEPDLQANSKPDSMMLEAVRGNVELMETMLIINQIDGLLNFTVGNIQVISPYYGNGLSASNEELFYCFKQLNRFYKVPNNQFLQGTIKLARKYELVALKFAHIMRSGESSDWNDEYRYFKSFKSALPMMDQITNGNKDDKIKALNELLRMLEGRNLGRARSNMQSSLDATYHKLADLKLKHIDLYNSILLAISELKGARFRQQLKDHDQWLESIMIHKHGLTGTYLDNPGNLNSETLNLVTKLVTEAYLNTRSDMQRVKPEIRKMVNDIKKEASFSYLEGTTVGNLVSLYSDLFEERNGDLLFVHPDTVGSPAKAKFLRYALRTINKNRFGWDDELCAKAEAEHNIEYFLVPLCVGSDDSTASEQGLLSLLRAKLSYLNPKTAWEMARKKIEGVFSEDENYDREKGSLILYKMSNMFDYGLDLEKRLSKIAELKKDKVPIEKNLETLLMKHIFAYSVLNNMDTVFPVIKAAMVHLQMQGALKNDYFKQDTKYFEEYVRNKIFNKSIINENNKDWSKKAAMLKQAASIFTLAISPVQAIYLPLQGLWTDVRLMIQKPDGKESFTSSHFRKALKLVFSDLAHFSEKPTLCSALNELYGINDMDMNSYVDKISTAKKGIWNFTNFLMKFSQRPDFYNRMTIFTSLMMGDGCLEAHHIDENGRLIYDWTKDKRFNKFAANPTLQTTDPEYNKLKSLYYAVAQLFVNEHTKNADGSDFIINMKDPMPLPRAYTNKQAESMKSLGDDIYGYYSHEKKSLIMSTCLGSLWLQFRTYWSGKKNQYLGSSGVKLKGSWNHVEENGLKYYYQIDKKTGEVLYDEAPITEEEANKLGIPLIAPVMQWKGQWLEGIIITLMDLLKSMWDSKSIRKGWNKKLGEDTLRLVYLSNMKQFAYDTIMWLIVGSIIGAVLGDWLEELKKDNVKNRDFVEGLGVAAANVAVLSVKNSFLDFSFIESIGLPFSLWTPFSFEFGINLAKNWWSVATGDEDFYDAVVKTFGATKQIKPALDTIKPDMFRTEREGGTFGKE